MRKTAHFVAFTSVAAALLGIGLHLAAPAVNADDDASHSAVCKDIAKPPKDAVTQGFCIAINRRKGNCMACHALPNMTSGDIAPPLVSMKQRYPDKAKLRDQIWDASKANPHTVMPPFGRHQILTPEEIDKVVEFVLTL
jgi:sulfur-oxidizing protein SoxX